MGGLAKLVMVILLAFYSSGVAELTIPEPCQLEDGIAPASPEDSDEGSCSPTCLRCGCCFQSVELFAVPVMGPIHGTTSSSQQITDGKPLSTSLDILHVPKPS
jgi:hypothetical protein